MKSRQVKTRSRRQQTGSRPFATKIGLKKTHNKSDLETTMLNMF